MSLRLKTVMLTAFLISLVSIAAAIAVIVLMSPGRPSPLFDARGRVIPGSISERSMVEINGVPQGMFIQSTDASNPVLLFLHGGPGMPFFFFNAKHPTGLEKHFTMVFWEQRGAGISFSNSIPADSMTVDQMVADTITVADYLRKRFGQEKIYLLGHSWGSFIGIQAAAAAPDRFHAYIGMGQLVYQLKSEVLARKYMIDAYRSQGDYAMVRKLEAAPASMTEGLSDAYMRLRDEAMHKLGIGTTRSMRSVVTGIFLPVWRCDAYTVVEKINIWRGKAWSRQLLWPQMVNVDLSVRSTKFDLPVYFLVGRYDYTANTDLAHDYFAKIKAPLKGFYMFDRSAHSPLFEEPERAKEILLLDVFAGSNAHADAN